MIDVDFFKAFNDKYGHPEGDRALHVIAQHLKKATRTADAVSRYGGEEFAMILPETHSADAFEVAERIRVNLQNCSLEMPYEHPFTLSIGLATFPEDGMYVEELIKNADQALYQAKQKGRNKVMAWKKNEKT
jgi:diguanylate cyclase (GGDEF)-like protein